MVNSTSSDIVVSCDLQVWEEVDQGGEDQREADGGSPHWNSMGVSHIHCFRQGQTDLL